MVADDGVRQGVHSKASTLMWRSARCKRAVNSTLAGETIAMSAALADAEWAQIMIQDMLDETVTVRDKTGGNLPFQVVLRSNCTLSKRLLHDHSIDAKSVFDALIKESLEIVRIVARLWTSQSLEKHSKLKALTFVGSHTHSCLQTQ